MRLDMHGVSNVSQPSQYESSRILTSHARLPTRFTCPVHVNRYLDLFREHIFHATIASSGHAQHFECVSVATRRHAFHLPYRFCRAQVISKECGIQRRDILAHHSTVQGGFDMVDSAKRMSPKYLVMHDNLS